MNKLKKKNIELLESKFIVVPTVYKIITNGKPLNEVLDKIRAEITAIDINRQVDAHTMFIRSGDQVKQMVLDIIDKYKTEGSDK